MLLDLLRSLNWESVEKKRTSSGFQLTGVRFKNSYVEAKDKSYEEKVHVHDLEIY